MPTLPPWLRPTNDLVTGDHVDVITCDVFDTLVWREVATPSDQFVHVAPRLRAEKLLPEHVDDRTFAGGRVVAEHRARVDQFQRSGSYEVGIDAIWAEMPSDWTAPHDRARAASIELDVESERLRLHHDVWTLLRAAHDAGVPTVLVSDIYVSADQLRAMLAGAGAPIEVVTQTVTSADRGRAKADGLLREVLEELGVDPARALHIGDHPVSDLRTARELGCHVLATDVARADRLADALTSAARAASERIGTDGGLTGAVRTTLVRAGETATDPAYQFGACVVGPVIGACAAWMSDTGTRLGVERVHYLLREGDTLAALARSTRPDGPDAVLVHASRWVFQRAAVIRGEVEELERAVLRRSAFDLRHLTAAFGVPVAEAERVLGTDALHERDRRAGFRALLDDDAVRSMIMDASAALRTRVLGYLDRVLVPTRVDGRDRLVVADIGWGGTIQEALTDLLTSTGRDLDVFGLYLLLSTPGTTRVYRGARMEGFLPVTGPDAPAAAIVMRNPELLEQVCTPDSGTLIDVDDDGVPVLAPVSAEDITSRSLARRGLFDAVDTGIELGTFAPGSPFVTDPTLRSAMLSGVADTVQHPSGPLARTLATWSHDDVAGSSVEGLVGASWTRSIRYLDAASADRVAMRDLFWLPGAAAIGNPTLAAQLEAVQRGVHAEHLCPPSELGTSLIAVHAPGTDLAVLHDERIATTGAHGWTLQWVSGQVPGVRDVRVDFGDRTGLVEIAFIEVRLRAGDRTEHVEVTSTAHPGLRWGDARPVGPTLIAVGPEGHVVVPVPADLGQHVRHAEVHVAFRTWATEVPEPRIGPLARRARRVAGGSVRRVRSAVDASRAPRRRPTTDR